MLLDLLSRQIDGDTVRQLSNQVESDVPTTQKAIAAALPLLIGGLSREAERSPEGAASLAHSLEQDHDGSLLDNLGGLLRRSTSGSGNLMDAASSIIGGISADRRTLDGGGILRHVFGNRLDAVALGISRASGMDVRRVNRLLQLLAPIVMGGLGRLKREQNLDAGGVGDLLRRERQEMEREAPVPGGESLLHRFLDTDDDGQIADDVAKLGGALGGAYVLGRMFGGKNDGSGSP